MKLPTISIVIPSYNKVKYIDKTLKSIFDQNYPNLEVIIQDGGSTDGSLKIIKKYTNKNPIILESKKDSGQLDAINKGMNKATGDILAFINADDEYESESFKSIANAYLNNPNARFFAGMGTVIDDKGIEIAKIVTLYKNLLLVLSNYYLLLTNNYLIQPSVFFTKVAYQKYGPFTGTNNFVMEYDLWLKMAKVKMPIVINKNLSKFRIEPGTKTKQMSRQLLEEDEKIIKKYTTNKIILFFHKLNNIGRLLVEKFV